jgi:hypothetical protein
MPWRSFGALHCQYDGTGRLVTRIAADGPSTFLRSIRDGNGTWIEDGSYPDLAAAKAGPSAERHGKRCKQTIALRRARQLRPDVNWSGGAWTRREMGGIARSFPAK